MFVFEALVFGYKVYIARPSLVLDLSKAADKFPLILVH